METELVQETPFWAFTRICLNNWHYITKRTLSFNQGINFFTGHSGSGKSTVIDAMQIVLYANTDGRGFFNKAAADDSDRNLIEYLRGMVNIGENNEFSYLRNKNFSTTIVLELQRTDSEEYQCIGVVFDVETSSNEISRRFFWHKGPMWDNAYRTENRAMSIKEVETYLMSHYDKESCFFTSHNERFRSVLYDCYLGGLDKEKFPLLFKRAIPFRMNIRLEDFVKEYICTEQNIHIEDMQESVMQYGRMRRKIEEAVREIEQLKKIRESWESWHLLEEKKEKYTWFCKKLEVLGLKTQLQTLTDKARMGQEDEERLQAQLAQVKQESTALSSQRDDLLRQIASTGYEDLKNRLSALNELTERLGSSQAKWEKVSDALKKWEEEEITSNQTLWDIGEFENRSVNEETLNRLKRSLKEMKADVEKQRQETVSRLRQIREKESAAEEELVKLKAGNKAYPAILEEARSYIQRRIFEETKKSVFVHVLADLLDIKDENWRNAVEGYLGNNKLNLIVPPDYAKLALRIYGELDEKKYFKVSILDTEKALNCEKNDKENVLAKEVTVRESYLEPYISFLLGKVEKCHSVDELRSCRTGITPECLLYHNFRLKHINPEYYTRNAYIGKDSLRRRIRILEAEKTALEQEKLPLEARRKDCERILSMEYLQGETTEYLQWLDDIRAWKERCLEKKKLSDKLEQMKEQDVGQLETKRQEIETVWEEKKKEADRLKEQIISRRNERGRYQNASASLESELHEKEKNLSFIEDYDRELSAYLSEKDHPRYDREREAYEQKCHILMEKGGAAWEKLLEIRNDYSRKYPNRSVPLNAVENTAYDSLLQRLSCDHLEEYKEQAAKQAKAAVEHFKDDFIYKIRSAIKEAMLRKDELNKIISRLDFGKDKYQFVITKNRGADGRYFDMFMDDALEINPAQLSHSFENQMNLFTMEHENQYADCMNELISMFIPPENASAEELEESRRNMEKYADYRTYLSFDMQQLIENEDGVIKIRLSRMIKKNSGGEGQNPLYVALLASFAQAYRIGQTAKLRRSPTLRLVVLDEAFSKMDAEKVASCIELIRGLGFQAIISATNDKIQNYVENVDKTFVFANPNKKSISIQEFEKGRMQELAKDLSGDGE